MPKQIERGDPLVLLGMVCYAEKQGKPFWFSSLGQMVQFDIKIFGRTSENYFGQFVWIEKKVTIIVAFHFMKRRLNSCPINYLVLKFSTTDGRLFITGYIRNNDQQNKFVVAAFSIYQTYSI